MLETVKNQTEVSRLLGISRATIVNWISRYKNEGNYLARKRPGAKSRMDEKKLKFYLNNHIDATIKDLRKVFGMSHGGYAIGLRS